MSGREMKCLGMIWVHEPLWLVAVTTRVKYSFFEDHPGPRGIFVVVVGERPTYGETVGVDDRGVTLYATHVKSLGTARHLAIGDDWQCLATLDGITPHSDLNPPPMRDTDDEPCAFFPRDELDELPNPTLVNTSDESLE